jgi:lactam utilization protein B
MLRLVSSAACGFHAGDPLVMAETVRVAEANGVGIGAHPSFHDLEGTALTSSRRCTVVTCSEFDFSYRCGAFP